MLKWEFCWGNPSNSTISPKLSDFLIYRFWHIANCFTDLSHGLWSSITIPYYHKNKQIKINYFRCNAWPSKCGCKILFAYLHVILPDILWKIESSTVAVLICIKSYVRQSDNILIYSIVLYTFFFFWQHFNTSNRFYLNKQQQIANNSIIRKKECIPLSKESW